MTIVDEIRDMSVYELATMAGCGSPDSSSSPGGRFLDCVRDNIVQAIDEGRITLSDHNDRGQISEISDDAPSVYTHGRWEQFLDLGAYSEDCEISDAWPNDLTEAAGMALYQIADRLGYALAQAYAEGWTCPVCGDEVDVSDCDESECGNPAGALVGLARERMADVEAEATGPVEAPSVPVEPLPVRTPGLAMAEIGEPVSDVYTGPVDLPVSDPILTLIDQREASDMGIRVTRAAMAHDRRVSRFRRKVWTVTGILAVLIITAGVLLFG